MHRVSRLLWSFVKLQALSCLFAFSVMGLVWLSHWWSLGLPRYDFLLLACLLLQAAMIIVRFESWREALIILCFHALGFALEAFKVQHGSWSYPEPAYTKALNVPLYAGFMYASVGSYMAQAWRRFQMELWAPPPLAWQWGLATLAYLNFFTHHVLPDIRLVVSLALVIVYWRTRVHITLPDRPGPAMRLGFPLPLAFVLIGLLIYFAENLATAGGAWLYPHQLQGWQPVHPQKILSWTLMVVVAFIIVSSLRLWEARRESAHGQAQGSGIQHLNTSLE